MPLVISPDCPCCGQKMPPQSHHEPYRSYSGTHSVDIVSPPAQPEGLALYLAREIAFAKRVLTAFGDFGRGIAHLFPEALGFAWYWGRYLVPCAAAMYSARWVGHLTYCLTVGHESDASLKDLGGLGLMVYALIAGLVFSVIWIADQGRRLREERDNLP